jgi:hypothetical protein
VLIFYQVPKELIVWDIRGRVNKKAEMRQNLHTGKNFLSNLAKHREYI